MLTDLVQALTVTAEVTGYPLSEAALDVMVQDLIDYPEHQVVQALRLCRRECKGRLTLRDILERIDDGRPGLEAAWAQVLWLKDERKSAVWCEEMRAAWAVALPLLDSGDEVAARMAFKETYGRRLTAARSEQIPPRWTLTPGSDPDHREQVVTEAAAQGRISAEEAQRWALELSRIADPEARHAALASAPAHWQPVIRHYLAWRLSMGALRAMRQGTALPAGERQ